MVEAIPAVNAGYTNNAGKSGAEVSGEVKFQNSAFEGPDSSLTLKAGAADSNGKIGLETEAAGKIKSDNGLEVGGKVGYDGISKSLKAETTLGASYSNRSNTFNAGGEGYIDFGGGNAGARANAEYKATDSISFTGGVQYQTGSERLGENQTDYQKGLSGKAGIKYTF